MLKETQPLESLRSHPVGRGEKARGRGQINSWLLGRMADCALSILQDSTEPPGAASAVNRGAESAEH